MPTIKEAILGTDEQNRKGQEMLDKQASEGSKLAKFLGGNPEPKQPQQAPVQKKKGGTIMEHKHNVDHVKKHYKSADHQHEQDKVSAKYKQEPHKMHHEHVKSMAKGGKSC
jgi:hypothetical protein